MGLDAVVQEVRKDGKTQAQELVQSANREAESLLAAGREKADAHRKARDEDAKRDAQQVLRQASSRAASEARKVVLQSENRLRQDLRQSVLSALEALASDVRAGHIDRLSKRAKGVVPDGRIWGAAADKDALGASGYEFAGVVDIAGGIIVESADGRNRLDLSYETLLEDAWRDALRSEAALFA